MVQGIAFILTSLIMTCVPASKKNPNKFLLVGAILFVITNIVTGPIMGIPVPLPTKPV